MSYPTQHVRLEDANPPAQLREVRSFLSALPAKDQDITLVTHLRHEQERLVTQRSCLLDHSD